MRQPRENLKIKDCKHVFHDSLGNSKSMSFYSEYLFTKGKKKKKKKMLQQLLWNQAHVIQWIYGTEQ